MIVNDDLSQLCLLSAIVEKHGYAVSTYTGAETALQDMAKSDLPSVIITDIQMPGMDGWQFCRILRSTQFPGYNDIPVIAVSSVFNDIAAERTTLMVGADAFLSVPVDADELIRTIGGFKTATHTPNRGNVVILDSREARGKERSSELGRMGFRARIAIRVEEALECVNSGETEVLVATSEEMEPEANTWIRRFREIRSDLVIVVLGTTASAAVTVLRGGADSFARTEDTTEYIVLLIDRAKRTRAFSNVEDLLRRRTWELQLSREKSRSILESMTDAVYVVSSDYRIEYMNPAAEKLFGSGNMNEPCYSRLYEQNSQCPWCTLSRTVKGLADRISVHYYQKSKFLSVSTSPMPLMDGSSNQLCIVRDMTHERDLEEQMNRGELLRRIGHLAGGMAHDFNNALGSIMGYADLARETNLDENGVPVDRVLGKRLEMIMNAAGRTAGRIKQLLDFSRQGKYRHEIVDLHEIVGSVIESIRTARESEIQIQYELCSSSSKIKGDSNQICSALMSIAENAIEAMSGDGKLIISTWIEDASDRHWNNFGNHSHQAQRIVVAVTDTGKGIEKSVRSMLFDPFFTTKNEGMGIGLGLASAYGIAKVHGGDIEVDSGENGTTFRMWFPLPVELDYGQSGEPVRTGNLEYMP